MSTKKRSTPGVYRTEKDLSNRVVPSSTSIGATVVRSKKGPINRPVIVTDDSDYVSIFGEPVFTSGASSTTPTIPEMGYGQYSALIYSRISDATYVVRDFDAGDTYAYLDFDADGTTSGDTATSGVQATSDPDGLPDASDLIYSLDEAITTGNSLLIGSVGPGLDGNNFAVTVETFNSACDWFNTYDDYTTDTATSAHPIGSKVFKIQVFNKKDTENWNEIAFSGISASPVETYYGTRLSQKDANGQQLKIDDVVNGVSNNIYVVAGTADFSTSILNTTPSSVIPLVGGNVVYGTNIGSTDGWDFYSSRERTSQNIMIVPDYTMSVKKYVAEIGINRKDCFTVGQSGLVTDTTVAKVKASETYGYSDPSFMSLYGGWDKFYDKYNDRYVMIPKAIYGAVLMARTDSVANVWDAPAGVNRGIIPSEGQNKQWDFEEVGQLYNSNINTSLNVAGLGDVMWGQKTAQLKASKLDRINTRRLLTYIENTLEASYLPFLFEPNNEGTRTRLKNISDSFLEGISAGGGFNTDDDLGFLVVCDATNNTPAIIDANKMVVQVYAKPAGISEFIELETTITKSGISFSEVIA